MRTHELKIAPEPYVYVIREMKKAEFRLNDRNFQVNDLLHLREYLRDGGLDGGGYFTGSSTVRRITHIQTGFGIPDGYVVLSMERT